MLITQIFGKEPRSMLEYVGWLKIITRGELSNLTGNKAFTDGEQFKDLVWKAHTILSQLVKEEWFVRPEEPKKEDFVCRPEIHKGDWARVKTESGSAIYCVSAYEKTYKKWQNWQPMFKGEWKIAKDGDIIYKWDQNESHFHWGYWKLRNLNDFVSYCSRQNIPLELN